ncbi:MAG: signal peptidase I [Bacilli bacterium]|nr:signal peptidase I [Bacilli bacterium]
MEKLLENKIFKICSSIIEWIIIIVLFLLVILVGVQKFSNRGNFFGYRIYTIISGSMIPTYDVGDTLLIKEMTSDNIEIGDAVTYLGEGGEYNGKIITHEVIDIELDANGKYLFHTKGKANNIEDPIVSQDQVLGKVIHKFFFLTMLGKITTSLPLLFICVIIPLAIIIAIEIIKLVYKTDEEIDEEVKEEIEELEEIKKEEEKEEKLEEKKKEEQQEKEKIEHPKWDEVKKIEKIEEKEIPVVVEEKKKETPVLKEEKKPDNNQNQSSKKKKKKRKYYYYNKQK